MKPPKTIEVAAGEPLVAVKIGMAAITGKRTLRDSIVRASYVV